MTEYHLTWKMVILIICPFNSYGVPVKRKDQNFDLWLHPPTYIIPLSCLILLFLVMERVSSFIWLVKKAKPLPLYFCLSFPEFNKIQLIFIFSKIEFCETYPFLFLYTNVVEHLAMEMEDIEGHLPLFQYNFFSWLSF